MLLPLQKGILYGPIDSRRLGRSLGINLMPSSFKLCSYNCVYCHYGCTKKQTLILHDFRRDLPPPDDVVRALVQAAKSTISFDFLTFSGNGEPTLYPDFPELVEQVVRIRDKFWPTVKIALLSNSSGLLLEHVRGIISKIDMPVFKYSIDRPVPTAKISLLRPERLEQIALQGQKETGVKIRAFYLNR